MSREEIIQFIEANQIGKNSSLIFTIIENRQEVVYQGRLEFNNNGTPAISHDRIGIRIQKIKGVSDMPYVDGLIFENLESIRINE